MFADNAVYKLDWFAFIVRSRVLVNASILLPLHNLNISLLMLFIKVH